MIFFNEKLILPRSSATTISCTEVVAATNLLAIATTSRVDCKVEVSFYCVPLFTVIPASCKFQLKIYALHNSTLVLNFTMQVVSLPCKEQLIAVKRRWVLDWFLCFTFSHHPRFLGKTLFTLHIISCSSSHMPNLGLEVISSPSQQQLKEWVQREGKMFVIFAVVLEAAHIFSNRKLHNIKLLLGLCN